MKWKIKLNKSKCNMELFPIWIFVVWLHLLFKIQFSGFLFFYLFIFWIAISLFVVVDKFSHLLKYYRKNKNIDIFQSTLYAEPLTLPFVAKCILQIDSNLNIFMWKSDTFYLAADGRKILTIWICVHVKMNTYFISQIAICRLCSMQCKLNDFVNTKILITLELPTDEN